jgi:phage terminase large subunit-like protein
MADIARPHVAKAQQYVEDVLSGAIPACKWARLACQRHKRDLARVGTADFPYHFDAAKAERACKIKSLLPHVKGRWAKKKELYELGAFQCFITAALFGWVTAAGLRRFTEAYIEEPRKNGKSFDAAATGLIMFAADDEYGAEVYSGATSEKQAWEVFTPALEMARRTPEFCYRFGVEVRTTQLLKPDDRAAKFEPVIGKPGDGSSPHCAIIDEFHEHTTPDLYDTMALGMGAREQPLLYVITTAGTSLSGPCYQRHLYACSVLEGTTQDEHFFTIIYTIDEGDDWTTLEAARKANPNFGVSILPERIEADLKAALQSAYKQNAYKTKRLNVWCGAKAAWMNMQAWLACPPRPALAKMKGRRAFLGVDLGATDDPSALAALFPPDERIKLWCLYLWVYLPEAAKDESTNAAEWQAWAKAGHVTLTPGNVADYGVIEADVMKLRQDCRVQAVGFDPWQAVHFASNLLQKGVPMVKVPQNVQQLSEPMKHVERLVTARQFAHGNNPVLNWMMGNVTAQEDKRGNTYPNKQSSGSKIDGVLAMLNAMNRAIAEATKRGSIDEWLKNKSD